MKSGHSLQAIDLSLKHHHYVPPPSTPPHSSTPPPTVLLLKPEPRPAWSILWYRSIWPKIPLPSPNCSLSPQLTFDVSCPPRSNFNVHTGSILVQHEDSDQEQLQRQPSTVDTEPIGVDLSVRKDETEELDPTDVKSTKPAATIVDVATCDGPVHFQRISNPNFALTVEHRERTVKHRERTVEHRDQTTSGDPPLVSPPSKTYLCIYCNQSFKSLFCYQKHKKRHLNPVSVDIPPNPNPDLTHSLSQNTLRTTDLNVQFFPCKKCGSKFPSYYFVHKHKRICDMTGAREEGQPVEQV